MLLTGLGLPVVEWRRRLGLGEVRNVVVDLEGHGREEFLSGVDLSRTVGWFTSLFPVRLDVGVLEDDWARGGALGKILKRIKEQLRQLPDNGVGYGVLRYMNAEAGEPLAKLTKFSRPELLEVIRTWRKQVMPASRDERMSSAILPVTEQRAT